MLKAKKNMKKIITIILISSMFSCDVTTKTQDVEMLQKQFKTVYSIDPESHICIDSLNNVFHVKMSYTGQINSKVKVSH